ncbi:MAG: Gfo/Idh/MocA family oxidoreductase [Spirochaetales bacterium]|nr:Gfo/Idh/MocA family oxidoreductase [Spirochaetales bacterium]
MKIGILGTGGIARVHIEALKKIPGAVVSAIAGRNYERTQKIAMEFGISSPYSSYEELIDEADLEAVINCTPNFLHAPLSIRALDRGHHVLCEKPMSTTTAEAEAMVKSAHNAGKLLMPAMCFRFEERTMMAAEIINEGRLGDIYYIKADFLRRDGQPGGWFTDSKTAGGGALLDIGVHILDLSMFLSNCGRPVSVKGQVFYHPAMMDGIIGTDKWVSVNQDGNRDVETFGTGLVAFDNGITINLEAGWNQHREKDLLSLAIYGTKGGLQIYPELRLFRNKDSKMVSEELENLIPEETENGRFKKQAQHFIQALKGETECTCPAEDGLKSVQIIENIYNSSIL